MWGEDPRRVAVLLRDACLRAPQAERERPHLATDAEAGRAGAEHRAAAHPRGRGARGLHCLHCELLLDGKGRVGCDLRAKLSKREIRGDIGDWGMCGAMSEIWGEIGFGGEIGGAGRSCSEKKGLGEGGRAQAHTGSSKEGGWSGVWGGDPPL